MPPILQSHINISAALRQLDRLAFAGHEIVDFVHHSRRDFTTIRLVGALYGEVYGELPHHVPAAGLHDLFVRVSFDHRTGLGA